jgi:hypothetical protein
MINDPPKVMLILFNDEIATGGKGGTAKVSFQKFPGIGTKRRERNWEGSGRVSKRLVFIEEY